MKKLFFLRCNTPHPPRRGGSFLRGAKNGFKKCFKNEKKQLSDVKKAVKQGNKEGARIYAQNAIREKTQAMNYLRLSSRVDAVASRLETAIRTKQVRPGPLLIPRTNG